MRVGIDSTNTIDPEDDPFQGQDHNDIHRCGSFDSQMDDSQATLIDSSIGSSMGGSYPNNNSSDIGRNSSSNSLVHTTYHHNIRGERPQIQPLRNSNSNLGSPTTPHNYKTAALIGGGSSISDRSKPTPTLSTTTTAASTTTTTTATNTSSRGTSDYKRSKNSKLKEEQQQEQDQNENQEQQQQQRRHRRRREEDYHCNSLEEDDKENFSKFQARYQQKHSQMKNFTSDGTNIHTRPSEDLDFKGSLYSGPEFQELMKKLQKNHFRHDLHLFDPTLSYNSSIQSNGIMHGQSHNHRHSIIGCGTVESNGVTEFGELTMLNIQRLNNNNNLLNNINKGTAEMKRTDSNIINHHQQQQHPYPQYYPHRHSWTQNVERDPSSPGHLEYNTDRMQFLKNIHSLAQEQESKTQNKNHHPTTEIKEEDGKPKKKNVETKSSPLRSQNIAANNSLMSSVIQNCSDLPNSHTQQIESSSCCCSSSPVSFCRKVFFFSPL